ncbi:uracil-DNA glycosylase [Phenylobacterium sp.]|uniref:uracil-DNA glycosylase n=1 Tax=Phenylobacterium sp. TaxID=1871053 RepID=UPI00273583C6|nr:uracil-DNA glycosylase [Phenylobacterium sp.]MDP3854615.1 uracil-DNA glycosylase [Phenylobacterium sp.]
MTISPRTLRSAAEIERRLQMLKLPHMVPLARWVETLRARYPNEEFPDFDPLGGGVGAEVLFILEKPGPKTSRAGGGSGFISVNNDDATAEASCRFLDEAGIVQARTCHWNLISGWNRTIAYKTEDWRAGMPLLFELLGLMPRIGVIVLVGSVAQRADEALRQAGYEVVRSAHPSPKVRNMNRIMWDSIPHQWAIASLLASGPKSDLKN